MEVSQIFLHVFALTAISHQTPFIFDDSVKYCQYFLSGYPDKYFETTSETQSVKVLQSIIVHFKLCDRFGVKEECPEGTVACLENITSQAKYHFGSSFVLEGDNLRSTHGSSCSQNQSYSLIIHMRPKNEKPSFLNVKDKCSYHIAMTHREHSNRCGIKVYGRFLDLSGIARTFKVRSNDTNTRKFSVTLCGSDASCGLTSGLSACETDGKDTSAISTYSSQSMAYDGDKNQLVIRGDIRGPNNRIVKRLEVYLKCDWDKTEVNNGDFKYVHKQKEGRKYTFHLETSYGCIKKPPSCIVRDTSLIYDLSNLYSKRTKPWAVDGKPYRNNSVYFLEVCGPLHLVGRNNSCKSTYAQVCENVNGIDINRGSVFSNLAINGDGVLRATIDSGAKCQEKPDLQYKTMVDFICDKNDIGPKFESYGNCDTYFQWRTPEACPRYDPESCSYVRTDESRACIFDDGVNYYDLSAIAETKVMMDREMPDWQFKLNICGPVLDPDVPCMKDVSVIMKNLSEPNVKFSVVSLGKYQGSTIINSSVLLEYGTGTYCDGADYRSEIRVDCSDNEELFLAKRETCYFLFVWQTRHGCPKTAVDSEFGDIENCSFVDSSTNARINFGHVRPLKVRAAKYVATVFVCGGFYSNCTLNDDKCVRHWFGGTKATFAGSPKVIIELNVTQTCSSPDDFNKVTVNFLCDEFGNNGYFGTPKTSNCNVEVDYVTSTACAHRETSELTDDHLPARLLPPAKDEKLLVPTERPSVDCSIKSPFTNSILNISSLTNPFFKKTCPSTTFNDTFRFVRLLYNSSDVCRPSPSRNISYEVYLVCARDVSLSLAPSLKDEECSQHYNYEQQEYCKYFTARRNSHVGAVVGILLACFLIFGGLSCILFSARKRGMSCCFGRQRRGGFSSIYERDTQQ